ncbi:uncharacterized protein LOC111005912 isoform X2 [Momordica charantia]|uniref:Uncharacterized protein LOC111005912 isoform X2 n=1 Tax=Momordica charantia TaxID=3673 RepID=A0A6J1BVL7_MOMCH|nr:uncharacterized protein LOC111005912 isoform X2 [Momordica charantia]XP_022133297.1 uncharacterized protein LOC111005912 isoform X2 [Momordica charantia]XP_022133298.1 uncharacterized protein LOC111005912 isoform X2 [Momordica charantia]XP_022133299.1 uncharacterized protein LOC111005912 isoform X2 [Momordica charantia]
MEEASTSPLPAAFLDFLKANGLDASIYAATDSTPRYVRLKPGYEADVEEIEAEIKCKLERVSWLPGFYSLPPDVQIASSNSYKTGKIYGIDAASGAAVSALDILPGNHVLDLCAAPGAKLCMIVDLLDGLGSVTGVDVSQHRLAACRTLLQKYALGDICRLFVADGTAFALIPVKVTSESRLGESTPEDSLDRLKEWTSRRSWKERKKAAKAKQNIAAALAQRCQDPELIYYGLKSGVVGFSKSEIYRSPSESEILSCGYDRVLVDAECTHDGSVKHIQKFESWGWTSLQRRVLEAERTDNLSVLQLRLLTNGFRLLKAGGILVYSTCSLTVAQNEDIVEQFLKDNASAGDRRCQKLALQGWKNTKDPTLRSSDITDKWAFCSQVFEVG